MADVPLSHEWTASKWVWPLQHQDGIVRIVNTPERFEVGLAVQYFTPDEIEVKVIGQDLVVNCRHEERTDPHGRVTREINRTYHLPADVRPTSLVSHLTKKGVLIISANK